MRWVLVSFAWLCTFPSKRRSGASEQRSREGGSWVAFRTKSEVEIMDDGFKWRKYGKKSVKNSPSPRYIFYRILYIYFVRVSVHLFGSYLHISKRMCVCWQSGTTIVVLPRVVQWRRESKGTPTIRATWSPPTTGLTTTPARTLCTTQLKTASQADLLFQGTITSREVHDPIWSSYWVSVARSDGFNQTQSIVIISFYCERLEFCSMMWATSPNAMYHGRLFGTLLT